MGVCGAAVSVCGRVSVVKHETVLADCKRELAELKQAMWDRGRSHSRTAKERDTLCQQIKSDQETESDEKRNLRQAVDAARAFVDATFIDVSDGVFAKWKEYDEMVTAINEVNHD